MPGGKVKLELDKAGIGHILKSAEMASLINSVGNRLARIAGGDAKPFVTDRAISVVRVTADKQARDGALTRAATSIGLEVKQRKGKRR